MIELTSSLPTSFVAMIGQLLAVTPPPPDQTTTYIIMGGASLFIVYAFMRLNKRKTKRDPMDTPFQTRSLAQQRSTERQFEALLVEFSEMSRKMSAQLDTRAAKLEALITDADERIARLEVLNQQAPPRPNFQMPPEQPAYTPPPDPVAKADEVPPTPPIDPGHAEVYQLSDDGQGVHAIANALGRPSGEVELILALRPRG